ncbi:MAG: hypothetical protein HY870_06100 [Chloroflexi bacterium]|nr:hypothetical protein [Chloroflexota bacterium]
MPDVVRVKVHNGDIDVIAVSASEVFTGAYFVEDDIYFLNDIAEVVNFSAPTPLPHILADEPGGVNGPPAMTHVRVPEGTALELRTPKGNIHVAGKVGAVTAVADLGSIEVRGQTGPLNLTTHGDSHGITVDGVGGPLILATDNGEIHITVVSALVRASTGEAGNIFFSGELQAGDNYFTTTKGSDITVVMPRAAAYSVLARTASQHGITIQYPNIATAPVTICGTMDPGWPVDTHIDTNGQKARGQISLSPGVNPITSTTLFSGVVTPGYVAFHTTIRFIEAMIPDVSDVYVDTLDYFPAIPGIRERSDYTGAIAATAVPPAPAAASPAVTDPAAASALESFMNAGGAAPPTAIPLGNAPAAAAPTAVPAAPGAPINPAIIVTPNMGVITRGRAFPGHGDNCPLPLPLLENKPVRVYITSGSGQIRLLQMSPGRP